MGLQLRDSKTASFCSCSSLDPLQSYSASNTKKPHITALVIRNLKTKRKNLACIFTMTTPSSCHCSLTNFNRFFSFAFHGHPSHFFSISSTVPQISQFSLTERASVLPAQPATQARPQHLPMADLPLNTGPSDVSSQPRPRLPQLAPACPSQPPPRFPQLAPACPSQPPLRCRPGSLSSLPPSHLGSLASPQQRPPPPRHRGPALHGCTAPAPCASALRAAGPQLPAMPMLRTEKVLLLRSQQGRSVRVVREHYLRPDVPCRCALCRAACPRGEGADGGRLGVGAPGRRGRSIRTARPGIARGPSWSGGQLGPGGRCASAHVGHSWVRRVIPGPR